MKIVEFDAVLQTIITAAAKTMKLQDEINNDDSITDKDGLNHICRSYIAKLSNAYHMLVMGDVQGDLTDFYINAQIQKDKKL